MIKVTRMTKRIGDLEGACLSGRARLSGNDVDFRQIRVGMDRGESYHDPERLVRPAMFSKLPLRLHDLAWGLDAYSDVFASYTEYTNTLVCIAQYATSLETEPGCEEDILDDYAQLLWDIRCKFYPAQISCSFDAVWANIAPEEHNTLKKFIIDLLVGMDY